MADNYLERRMEDMKSGRLGTGTPQRRQGPRKGYVEFPFPPRRVAVAGGLNPVLEPVVRAYLGAGCKVAVMDADKEVGEAMAYKDGIRFCRVDRGNSEELRDTFGDLLKAWRDVDIVVTNGVEEADMLSELWADHRNRYPVPFGYTGRLIVVSNEQGVDIDRQQARLSPYRIAVNCISISAKGSQELGRLCLLLSLPLSGFISGQTISE